MAGERLTLRDWHRLFGLLLADFFTNSPFAVEVERDLSVQQQLLDVVIIRRGEGPFAERLPDGLEDLRPHNLVTFKSFHEALDDWAMKELVGHYVAYRKLVSRTPSELLPEEHFGLYAVAARFPRRLAGRVPWEEVRPGVYDCRWGTDVVRVVVSGELAQEPHNAPLHVFCAKPDLFAYGKRNCRRRSEYTSALLDVLTEGHEGEGYPVPYTLQEFMRDYLAKKIARLSPEERAEALREIPLEERLADLTDEQIREYLERRSATRPAPAPARKPRGKKK